MKIIWLEDEPDTILVIRKKIEKYCSDITLCQSFGRFTNEVETLNKESDYLIILDIRIIFNVEYTVTCFDKQFMMTKELEAGLEYYLACLKKRFNDEKIIFLSSKTAQNAQNDAKKYDIASYQMIAKEDIGELIERVKNATV